MRDISIAFDLGNSGGKVLAATMEEGTLKILAEENIESAVCEVGGYRYWDTFAIFRDLKRIMKKFSALGNVVSLGIDSASASYGYIGENGRLGSQVGASRDQRYAQWQKILEDRIDLKALYDATGTFPVQQNVINKVVCDLAQGDLTPEMPVKLAQLATLFHFFLTGEVSVERSMAGASVMLDPTYAAWNEPLLARLGIPAHILPQIAEPGTWSLPLLPSIAEEIGCPNCRLIRTVEFDAAAAMIAAPGLNRDQVYLSMGTTINPGLQTAAPVINDMAYRYRYKNVPLWQGESMMLSDLPGFFLLTECLKFWQKEDPSLDHAELIRLADACETEAILPLFDPRLTVTCPDMPEQIRGICAERGQSVPESIGEVARAIYVSYALTIAWSIERLCEVTGRDDYQGITAISGGSRNALLCQMIADATGLPVRAGAPKATCVGNLLVQFYAREKLHSLEEMREAAEQISEMKTYVPRKNEKLREKLKMLKGWVEDQEKPTKNNEK